jgi:hypothetical protein
MTPPEIVDIAERIAEHFPLGSQLLSLEVVPGATGRWIRGSEPAAVATIRSLTWDTDPATGHSSIRDIKEQEVNMGWPVYYDDAERIAAFFAALGGIITEIGTHDASSNDSLMPSDLLRADVLGLRRARTSADFDAALRAKSRLGLFLHRPYR